MGVDFLERTAPKFRKAISRDAEAVARMARGVSTAGHRRVVVADCANSSTITAGLALVVRTDAGQLQIIDGLHEVGRVHHPPPDVLQSIEELGGFAEGYVEHVNLLGGTFDVALP
jgi:hypothetical protein